MRLAKYPKNFSISFSRLEAIELSRRYDMTARWAIFKQDDGSMLAKPITAGNGSKFVQNSGIHTLRIGSSIWPPFLESLPETGSIVVEHHYGINGVQFTIDTNAFVPIMEKARTAIDRDNTEARAAAGALIGDLRTAIAAVNDLARKSKARLVLSGNNLSAEIIVTRVVQI